MKMLGGWLLHGVRLKKPHTARQHSGQKPGKDLPEYLPPLPEHRMPYQEAFPEQDGRHRTLQLQDSNKEKPVPEPQN